MKKKFVYIDLVRVYDDKVFTKSKVEEWKSHILRNASLVIEEFQNRIDPKSEIAIKWSSTMLDEVFVDAVIGLRKVAQSQNNHVQEPNAFKVIAYIAYWWLRHKPISLVHTHANSIEKLNIVGYDDLPTKERETKRQEIIWKLKHINELIATNFVLTYIFDLNKLICDEERCTAIKCAEKEFCFDSFLDMYDVMHSKLVYYFSYRAVAPKVIEHILEGYTMHPVWKLTGEHWRLARDEAVSP